MTKGKQIVTGILLAALLSGAAGAAQAEAICTAPAAVCAIAKRVFPISSALPNASAVLISQGLLVTTRDAVLDKRKVVIHLPAGGTMSAGVVPSSYVRNLILIKVNGLMDAPPLPIGPAVVGRTLYVIGAGTNRGQVRVSQPGDLIALPLKDKPKSRIHYSTPATQGDSGGALVDTDGRIVGFVSTVAEGRNDAIPATQLSRLIALTGEKHKADNLNIETSYRKCSDSLDRVQAQRKPLSLREGDKLANICRKTGNRHFFDKLGTILGEQGMLQPSVSVLSEALGIDPMAPNALYAMAVTLGKLGRYWEQIKYAQQLLTLMPTDARVLNLAIDAAIQGGDRTLAARTYDLLVIHHPDLAPAAKIVIDKANNRPAVK